MNVVIRTDASIEIGSGHVMRCLALADELKQRGMRIVFICRNLQGHLKDLIERKGYAVILLGAPGGVWDAYRDDIRHSRWLGVDWETDARQTGAALLGISDSIDWLIVDHYALGRKWEISIKSYVKKIMVIDDLADRRHECNLILDQNLYSHAEIRYDDLIPVYCRKMTGPRYAILRREFEEERENLRSRDGVVRNILVFFGGVDETNETAKAVQGISLLQRSDIHVDVIIGDNNPHAKEIESLCATMPNFMFHRQISNMASLMATADLAIGSGGTTTWERCCLGLPAIVSILGENQRELTLAVDNYGAIVNIGDGSKISSENYYQAICRLKPGHLLRMSELGRNLVDGQGAIRVADEIEKNIRH